VKLHCIILGGIEMKRKMVVMCLVILASCFFVGNVKGDTIRKLTVKRNLKVKKDLTVDGNVTAGTFTGDGSALTNLIPSGAVMFFNLNSCPVGWSELTQARGRYIVGLPESGTLGGTAGTALSDIEDRTVGRHNHTVVTDTHIHGPSTRWAYDGATRSFIHPRRPTFDFKPDDVGFPAVAIVNSDSHTHAMFDTGLVSNTNAPYI
jgi:hypothetical protein